MEIGFDNPTCWAQTPGPRRVEPCFQYGDRATWKIARPEGPDQFRPEAARIGDVPPVRDIPATDRATQAPMYKPHSTQGAAQGVFDGRGSLIDVIA